MMMMMKKMTKSSEMMMMMMTWRKCWTASGREAVGGAANSVAAIFLSIHES